MFASLRAAQAALDEWVAEYNTDRPHQSLDGATPAERFWQRHNEPSVQLQDRPAPAVVPSPRPVELGAVRSDRSGPGWVARKAGANGVVCISWQQVCIGAAHAGARVDVHVLPELLQIWRGDELIKTVPRTSRGEVRKKNASVQTGQRSRRQA